MGTLIYHPSWVGVVQRKPPFVVALKRTATVQTIVNRRQLKRHTRRLPDGRREFRRATLCRVNGREVMRREWPALKIGRLDVVQFVDLPPPLAGGNNGFLQIGALVLALAAAVAAPYIAPFLIGGATSGLLFSATVAGIGLAGAALSYGLVSLFASPQPTQQQQTAIGDTSLPVSPTYSLSNQGNTARLGQPVPELHGRQKVFPDQAGAAYSRFVDNDQFLHQLLVVTVGECEVESVLIGDTPIESFGDDIDYEIVEPGDLPDSALVDARWLVSTDVGEPELLPSETTGPFAVNPPQTLVQTIELDFVAPRGLFHAVVSGSSQVYDSNGVSVDIESLLIDDDDAPLGSWTAVATFAPSDTKNIPQRYTETYDLGAPGRYQIRVTRTDSTHGTSEWGEDITWTGLRGLQAIEPRTFADVTTLAIRMKATGGITALNSRKVAVIATRKYHQWDGSQFLDTMVASRNPCYAFAYIARARNGARLDDGAIDLDGIFGNFNEFEDAGWTFDFTFDSTIDCSEALRRVAASVVAERVVQGGKLSLVRDVQAAAPTMMFTPRNIMPGSLRIEYAMVDSTSADGITGQYIDAVTWKPRELTVAYPDSAQERLTTYQAYGVTGRDQLNVVLTNLVRGNRLRRRLITWQCSMEGLALQYGDSVRLAYDFPAWGQTAEIVAWDDPTHTATLSDQLEWTEGADHYILIRDSQGYATWPFPVLPIADDPMQLQVAVDGWPEILTGGDRERTFIQFGPGIDRMSLALKVKTVTPQTDGTAIITAFDDDVGMYADVDAFPDPGRSVDLAPLAITVDADDENVDLRALAAMAGYSGTLVQAVTVTILAGVTIGPSSSTSAAVVRGTWPAGYTGLALANRGIIQGADAMSGRGGLALDTRNGALTLDNVGGKIAGGDGDQTGYAIRDIDKVTWAGVDHGEIIGPTA